MGLWSLNPTNFTYFKGTISVWLYEEILKQLAFYLWSSSLRRSKKNGEIHSRNKGLTRELNLLIIAKEGPPLSREWVTNSLKDLTCIVGVIVLKNISTDARHEVSLCLLYLSFQPSSTSIFRIESLLLAYQNPFLKWHPLDRYLEEWIQAI